MMKTKVLCTALLVGLLTAGPAMAAITVSIVPANQVVLNSDMFSVDIVADIPVNEPVVGWGLDFTIADLTLVTQTGYAITPPWNPAPVTPDGDGLAGLAPFPGTGITGLVTLATIDLLADAFNVGTTALTLSDDYPADPTEGFAIDPAAGGGFATVNYVGGSVDVIPEPATMALLLIGGLAMARRRR